MKGLLLLIIIILNIISCSSAKKCITKNIEKVNLFENDFGEMFEAKYFVNETICQKTDTSYVLNGKYEIFSLDGILIQSSFFIEDKLNGELKEFHPNGKLKMISQYRNDSLRSISKIYNTNSELLDSNILNEGTGKYKSYYPNDQLAIEFELVNGVKEGIEISYDSTGVKTTECHFKNDLKNGNFSIFHPNKKIATKCEFQNDILVGEYLEYYESGNLKSKLFYKYPPYDYQDSLHLRLIAVDENNLLTLLDAFDPGGYFKGIKVGDEILYDENGIEIENRN
ncbi:MAG: toxin-antitoxin system YwqK family antitoxin [Saprospiraceae bacterium]|nr:toxin-antitoxin system YwqK family antitoxin [Saprospiraceae bacterium]